MKSFDLTLVTFDNCLENSLWCDYGITRSLLHAIDLNILDADFSLLIHPSFILDAWPYELDERHHIY